MGHQVRIAGYVEGVCSIGGNHIPVLSPVDEHIAVGRRGGHRAGGVVFILATAADSAISGIVGSNTHLEYLVGGDSEVAFPGVAAIGCDIVQSDRSAQGYALIEGEAEAGHSGRLIMG